MLGWPMESWNVTSNSIHFLVGVNYLAVPTSWVVNYTYSLLHIKCTWLFIPGFHWTNRFYSRKYIEGHNFTTLMWTWFLCTMSNEVSSKRFRIIRVHEFLGHILKVLFHSLLECFKYLQRKSYHSIYMWLYKLHSIYNNTPF